MDGQYLGLRGGSSMRLDAHLASLLASLGFDRNAAIFPGVRPSVLRVLPPFWSVGNRLMILNGSRSLLYSATSSFRSIGHLLASSETPKGLTLNERFWGAQLVVQFPNGERVVLDGRKNVQGALRLLRPDSS